MTILIGHQNVPGQYLHLAAALVARGDDVAATGGVPCPFTQQTMDIMESRVEE